MKPTAAEQIEMILFNQFHRYNVKVFIFNRYILKQTNSATIYSKDYDRVVYVN